MFTVYTHSRKFHADEVMAIALLIKYHFNGRAYDVIRTRDNGILDRAKSNTSAFVIDVGFSYDSEMLNFDHHQDEEGLVWEDGLPMSSCGLIWNWLKQNKKLNQHMNHAMMDLIEEQLIRKVDAHDNGYEIWPASEIICGYNRKTDDDKRIDAKFTLALKTACEYLDNFLYKMKERISEEKHIKKAIKQSEGIEGIVISDCNINSGAYLTAKMSDKKLFIAPRTNNSWTLTCVPIDADKLHMGNRMIMPEEWRGFSAPHSKEVLEPGLIFCHKSGHMCMIEASREDIIEIAKSLIKQREA